MATPDNRQQQKQAPQPPAQAGGMGGIFGFLQQLFGLDSNGNNFFSSLMSAFGLGPPTPPTAAQEAENTQKLIINEQQAELAAKKLYPSTGEFAQDGVAGSVMQHALRLDSDPNYARQYMKQALRDPNMDATEVMKLQGAMNKLGLDAGDVDGRMDNQARSALGQYLKQHPEDRRGASAEAVADSKPRNGVIGWFAEKIDNLGAAKERTFESPSTTPGSIKGLLGIIGEHESKQNYNAIWPKSSGNGTDFTKMTVNEVLAYQRDYTQNKGMDSSAVGRYQIIQKTLRGLKDDMGLSGNEKFDAAMQDKMAVRLLEQRGLNDFKSGRISAEKFQLNIAKEWASMPKDASGRSYYAGDGLNKAAEGVAKPVLAAIDDIKRAPIAAPAVARNNDIDFGRPAAVRSEGMEGASKRLSLSETFSAKGGGFGGMIDSALDTAKDFVAAPFRQLAKVDLNPFN